jgi:hypothetical protein
MSGMSPNDWLEFFTLLAMLAGVVGSVWILFDASNRFGPLFGFTLAIASIVCSLYAVIPWVVLAYVGYYLLAFHYFHREIPEDKLPRFGLTQSTGDPVGEAKKLGLPSVLGRKAADDVLGAGDEIPEIEELLRSGKVAEATVHAEAALKTAENDGHDELADKLRKYVLRLQRGKY